MGVAVPRAPVGTRSPKPPQKFGHGPLFVGQLLSRNQVPQKNRVNPPPLRCHTSSFNWVSPIFIPGSTIFFPSAMFVICCRFVHYCRIIVNIRRKQQHFVRTASSASPSAERPPLVHYTLLPHPNTPDTAVRPYLILGC